MAGLHRNSDTPLLMIGGREVDEHDDILNCTLIGCKFLTSTLGKSRKHIMPLIGNTPTQRKVYLAGLLVRHLNQMGYDAKTVKNYTNSAGHTDRILIESGSLGLIHVSAHSSLDQNENIKPANFQNNNQRFIADKNWIAFGWDRGDGTIVAHFVKPECIESVTSITRAEVAKCGETSLRFVEE